VKYALIEQYRSQFNLAAMCRILGVSRSGFYAAAARPPSRRSTEDLALRAQIARLHIEHRKALGTIKTWRMLNVKGIVCGKHRVGRLRKLDGIEAQRKARFRVMRTYQKAEPPAPDLVKRAFTVNAPNKVWVGDMTAVRTREGWLHLAVLVDLFARRVVGWSTDSTQAATLPIAALKMAIAQRRPLAGLICHSDQGSVYGASAYREILEENGLQPSMSRKGNCHDNAVAESFFSNLKNEITHHTLYQTRAEARAAISDYIEVYYNRQRPHQTNGYRTPTEVEAQYKVLN
jgi:transposase InsO family protein